MSIYKNFVVYKASAGSGKTFNLVLEYVSLLVRNTRAYKQILAMTFTNKATAEMKQRILSELYCIRIGKETSFFEALCQRNSDLEKEFIRTRAKEALENIIHDYSYFNILTIDSFLQKVMRNLAKELGVGSNYNLIIEDLEIRKEAIERLIESTGNDDSLYQWYMDTIYKNISEGKNTKIERRLLQFSDNLQKETFLKFENELKELDISIFKEFKKEGYAKIEGLRKDLEVYSDQFQSIMTSNGLSIDDFSNKSKGIAGMLMAISTRNDLLDKQTFIKALTDPNVWFAKKNQTPSTDALTTNTLIPLINKAYNTYISSIRIINTWNAILPNIDNIALLKDIANHRDDILKEDYKFLLSNTSKLLSEIIRLDDNGDISFIYEKIGTQLKYIMIDEFQDTSCLNWETLRPLVLESIDSGNRSVVVGDVKQSIYRWRNGDWRILNDINKGINYGENSSLSRLPDIKNLNKNYRTDANIIDFNNEVFGEGIKSFTSTIEGLDPEHIDLIKGVFSDSKQDYKEEVIGRGEVRCRFVVGSNRSECDPRIKENIIEEIDYYLGKGYKKKDIAILTRSNKNIGEIANYLTENNNNVVSDFAFSFASSKSLNLIIDCLRYISNKKNSVSLFNIKRSVFGDEKIFTQSIGSVNEIPEELSWLNNRESLLNKPLFELVVHIIKNLELDKNETELSFITSFCDKLQDYTSGNTSDINSFIKYWDEDLLETKISINEDYDGIRIISIHKAKGLEYPIVILPFANWDLTGSEDLWLNENKLNDKIPTLFAASGQLKNSLYSEDYKEETMQQYVDNLNILYVALTRPKHSISIIGQLPKKDYEKISNTSHFLHNHLNNKKCLETKQMGEDIEYYYFKLEQEKPTFENKEENKELNEATNNIFKIVPDQIPMQSGFKGAEIRYSQTRQARDYVKAIIEGKEKEINPRLQGIILHNLLSNIITSQDAGKSLETSMAKGEISQNDISYFGDIISKMLSVKEVESWFDGTYRVMNEVDIITKDKDIISSRRPDRLMVSEKKEAVIVDYKFASSKNSLELYSLQINEYKSLLEEIGFKNIKSYLWFVSFKENEFTSELVEVD
ncbi:MAG: UvrD-helicase domain-containing protein [Bacteroidales bacterium]|nr:UvrD-helicase domain-containing protein [Bacteroidales bacterium]